MNTNKQISQEAAKEILESWRHISPDSKLWIAEIIEKSIERAKCTCGSNDGCGTSRPTLLSCPQHGPELAAAAQPQCSYDNASASNAIRDAIFGEQPPATDDKPRKYRVNTGDAVIGISEREKETLMDAVMDTATDAAPRVEQWTPQFVADLISQGRTNPIKGKTGYHLVVDAHNASLAAERYERLCNRKNAARELATEREQLNIEIAHNTGLTDDLAAERQRREQAEKQDWRHMEKAHKKVLLERQVSQKLREQLLSAQAAIAKVKFWFEHMGDSSQKGMNLGQLREVVFNVDLSALHQHDEEVRKPLVDALKLLANEDNYLEVGFDPCGVASYALAKVNFRQQQTKERQTKV